MTRYRLRDNVKIAALAGEGVILHLESRRYYTANPTALVLLQELKNPRTPSELRAALMERFDVSAANAEEGVQAFLDDCGRAAIVAGETEG